MIIKKVSKKIKSLIIKENNSPLRKGKNGNFIFIHINKTGGTSIANAIGLPQKRHLNVTEIISIIGEEEFNKAVTFCVVRNPWSKVVSHYKYRIKTNQTGMADNPISFKEWVIRTYGEDKDPFYYNNPKMFAPQLNWLKDKNGVIRVKNILKFESLNRDFENFSKTLGIQTKLPHLNATKKVLYTDYYDKETVDIVGEWFKEDIKLFNYEFDKTCSNNV